MIYLYGIVAGAEGCCCDVLGIEEAPLRRFDFGWMEAVGSDHERLALGPTDDALWAHELVVEALLSSGAVVPARFGTTFTDEAALGKAVASRWARLTELLGHVRGRVELALRVREVQPGSLRITTTAARNGRDYLERRRQGPERLTDCGRHIHNQLAALAVDSSGPSWGHGSMTAAYLVDVDQVDAVRQSAQVLADRCQDIQLAVTGPWPPYSFVGVD
jgi:hypothetical protein